MTMQYTETVVAVAIGVLSAVFIGALFVLVVLCKKQRFYKTNKYCKQDDVRSDVLLIEPDHSEVELGEVRLNADLEQILADEQWIDDATGLIPHCLALLKKCHSLTERLTTLTMGPLRSPTSNQMNYQIEDVARKISERVDDVVRSMYPPLDPRLLEARASALILAVTHLAFIAYSFKCNQRTRSLYFIDPVLIEMNTHLLVLREAAMREEATSRIQNVISSNTSLL